MSSYIFSLDEHLKQFSPFCFCLESWEKSQSNPTTGWGQCSSFDSEKRRQRKQFTADPMGSMAVGGGQRHVQVTGLRREAAETCPNNRGLTLCRKHYTPGLQSQTVFLWWFTFRSCCTFPGYSVATWFPSDVTSPDCLFLAWGWLARGDWDGQNTGSLPRIRLWQNVFPGR